MPYTLAERGGQVCVVKRGETTPIPGGCHKTRREAMAHLQALYANEPAARAATVIAWYAPRLAFTEEDHPRDEHGRFTSKDGGGDGGSKPEGSSARTKLIEEALDPSQVTGAQIAATDMYVMDKLSVAFPNARIDLDVASVPTQAGLDIARGIADGADRLSREYPDVAASITEIVVKEIPGEEFLGTYYSLPDDPKGSIELDLGQLESNIGHMRLEEILLGPSDHYSDQAVGYNADPVRLGEGAITHEFGHAVDNYNTGLTSGFAPFFEAYRNGEQSPTVNSPPGVEPRDPHISAYSMTRPEEYFAEIFTAARVGLDDRLTETDRQALLDANTRHFATGEEREQLLDGFIDEAVPALVASIEDDLRPDRGPIRETFDGSLIWEYAFGVRRSIPRTADADFDEDEHPRDEKGQFAPKGGGERAEAEPLKFTNPGGPSTFSRLPQAQQDHLLAHAAKWGLDIQVLEARAAALLDAAAKSGAGDAGKGWYEARFAEGVAYAREYGITEDQWHGVVASLSPQTKWDSNTKDGDVMHPNLEHAETLLGHWTDNPVVHDDVRLQDLDARDAAQFMFEHDMLHDRGGSMFRANAENAIEMLQGARPGDVLDGDKTRAFYEQMTLGGRGSTAVIDEWMLAALTGRATTEVGGYKLGISDPGMIDVHVMAAGETSSQKLIAEGWDSQASVYSVFDKIVVDEAAARGISVADAQAMIWYQQRNYADEAAAASLLDVLSWA